VRVDVIGVYDIDVVFQGDAVKFRRDRAEEMPAWNAPISANFFNVMDPDPGTGVILRV
jgi:hypothetical protein